jgi:hypothetical protein
VTNGGRGVDTVWICDSPSGSDIVDTDSLSWRSRDPENNIRFFRWGDDDFFSPQTGTPAGWVFTGGTNRQINDPDGIGVTEIIAPATAAGQTAATLYTFTLGLICGGTIKLDTAGYFWMSLRFKQSVLSDGTTTFETRWGLANILSGDPTEGMWFSNDANSSSKIKFNMATGGVTTSTPTTVDMSVDTFVHGEARYSPADPGQVYVYINGVFQFKTSAHFPTELIGPFWQIKKALGAGQPTSRMDWHKGNYRLPLPRVALA